ncbi:endolytic transglycosylase MltG [Spirochaeta thermophila]|uniref:Endolytic murein transglycosylase n=1 Tax=Winmispira thermophila (strain ATCC 49972 / DSM 6192 / RI 19.B1) TaxID=665571 RepID=E0RSN8_WINT6|nr:endolytic transglycosylase MltG [Spirochaeta thermophila]ADN02025.1 hypothetical protein STHERM_c10800 [Spirochaeta thermophila DSM 6192]
MKRTVRSFLRSVGLMLLFVMILLLVVGGGAIYLSLPTTRDETSSSLFIVYRGDTGKSVSTRLADQGYIRSALAFELLLYLTNTAHRIRAGGYLLSPSMSLFQVHEKLTSGGETYARITIPEGWTASRIGRLLEREGFGTEEAFLRLIEDPGLIAELGVDATTLEGYLFPETYFFSYGTSQREIVKALVTTFKRRVTPLLPEGESISSSWFYRRLILASIVEREYRDPEEAPLIASVFLNRLERHIPLESCATVEYVLTEELGQPPRSVLTYDDLQVDSPFNTYRRMGLPPHPISNPGLVAIRAALEPAKTDYLYFVLKDPQNGRHYFSRSFEEHVEAKYLYLKPVSP